MTDNNDVAELAEALQGLLIAVHGRVPRDVSLTASATLTSLEVGGPRRITDLARLEGVTQPTMTSLVGTLERAGLIERHPDPTDRRATLIDLTEAGHEGVRLRRKTGTEAFTGLIGQLSAEERATLLAATPVLRRLRDLDNTLRRYRQ